MTPRCIRSFWHNEQAAISPLYAVGILALVGIAGVGFDYGRLMALDSELQNASDQAALAAATQLDGRDGAMQRARDAATNTFANAASDYVNETRFANDGSGRPITNLSFTFYDGYANDTVGNELTSDDDAQQARVVEVTVNARKVFYALTPVVGAFNSGDVTGKAMATLQSATCNVPPMMVCVPNKDGAADRNFPTDDDVGKGLYLHFKQNQTNKDTDTGVGWAPGNFGFLDIPFGSNSTKNQKMGLNSSSEGCFGDDVESRTGFRTPEGVALNTRFDIYPNANKSDCDGATGDFCPSENTRKDLVFTETKTLPKIKKTDPVPSPPACGNYDSRVGWTANAAAKNFKKDDCFLTGTCSVLGDGAWDYSTYMSAHHPGATAGDFGKASMADVTRYDVYNWELADPANRLKPERLSSSYTYTDQGANRTYTFANVCAYPKPVIGAALAASDTQKDRRVLTVAAVDCSELNGKGTVDILRWIDLFLVQPVEDSGADRAFFTEIIGPAKRPSGESGFQYYGRNKAVLIR